MSTAETGQVTGTKDNDYNIIWFTEACRNNALRLEGYIQDAEREGDSELADFFRRAQNGEPRERRAGEGNAEGTTAVVEFVQSLRRALGAGTTPCLPGQVKGRW